MLRRLDALAHDVDDDDVQLTAWERDPVVEVAARRRARVGSDVVDPKLGLGRQRRRRTYGLLQGVYDLFASSFDLGHPGQGGAVVERHAEVGGQCRQGSNGDGVGVTRVLATDDDGTLGEAVASHHRYDHQAPQSNRAPHPRRFREMAFGLVDVIDHQSGAGVERVAEKWRGAGIIEEGEVDDALGRGPLGRAVTGKGTDRRLRPHTKAGGCAPGPVDRFGGILLGVQRPGRFGQDRDASEFDLGGGSDGRGHRGEHTTAHGTTEPFEGGARSAAPFEVAQTQAVGDDRDAREAPSRRRP